MPGAESLKQQQYYAHPRNQFWRLMGALFGAEPELPYPARVKKLTAQGVAVWDVLKLCERPGSLDSSIRRETEVANDFLSFLKRHPGIRYVFFNGSKAENLFESHLRSLLGERAASLRFERLPSSSPAHASLSFDQKLVRWKRIKAVL